MARACGLTREASALWISDYSAMTISKVTDQGSLIASFPSGVKQARDLAWDGEHLWLVDSVGTIRKFTTAGVLVDSLTDFGANGWGLTYANGYLWVSSPSQRMIYKLSPEATYVDEGWPDSRNPELYYVSHPSPNPFSDRTTVEYWLAEGMDFTLRVYGTDGTVVKTLVRGQHGPGHHRAEWDGRDEHGAEAANGVYFYRAEARADVSANWSPDMTRSVSTGKIILID